MIYKPGYNSFMPLRPERDGLFLLLIFLFYLVTANSFSFAQSSYQKFRISYNNNRLTLAANEADLKNVLLKLADKTNIYVRFPLSLKKKVTIRKSGISLREALRVLLKGLNHAIIYSGPSKNQLSILEVFVFTKSKRSNRTTGREVQIANRIRAYERQIESLKKNLSGMDENSRRGKSYLRGIKLLEKNIERLERQLK